MILWMCNLKSKNMKTKHFFLNGIVALAFSGLTHAQTGNCELFTITSINPDTLIFGGFQVSIQFSGNASEFIGYPFIISMQNCNGDTVASGTLSWFGQFGQTEQDYPVTPTGDISCGPLTVNFQYLDAEGNEVICPLTYNPVPQGTCDLLSVTDIEPDSISPGVYQISVQYDGNAEDIIAGPVITSVLNCNGEIVATGNFFWFGHAGQTNQHYPVTLTGDLSCGPLTAYFQYLDSTGNEVICPLIINEIPASINETREIHTLRVLPNPAIDFVSIHTDAALMGSAYQIIDISGKIVQTGIVDKTSTELNLSGLLQGIYFFKLSHDIELIAKIVKM
jgi:hypothetical protein